MIGKLWLQKKTCYIALKESSFNHESFVVLLGESKIEVKQTYLPFFSGRSKKFLTARVHAPKGKRKQIPNLAQCSQINKPLFPCKWLCCYYFKQQGRANAISALKHIRAHAVRMQLAIARPNLNTAVHLQYNEYVNKTILNTRTVQRVLQSITIKSPSHIRVGGARCKYV